MTELATYLAMSDQTERGDIGQMEKYTWSIASALWQVANGAINTERTDSAFGYLREEFETKSGDELLTMANTLLDMLATARSA